LDQALLDTAEKYTFHEKKKKSGARKMKRAKSIFLLRGDRYASGGGVASFG